MEKATLFVKDLIIPCIIGCLDSERENPQEISLDVEVDYDISESATSDQISTAVDYRHIAESLIELIQEKKYQLVERLAHESCQLILERWKQIERVKFTIRKFKVLPTVYCTGITLERYRVGPRI